MRILIVLFFCGVLFACDATRVFEENVDFEERSWNAEDSPAFTFQITDHLQPYNVLVNFRNSLAYPKANIYYRYTLQDSVGKELESKLVNNFFFDEKTGAPFGSSGIGDIFDHQFPIMENNTFGYSGRYTLTLEQFMRMDTLKGVLSVGVRVERAVKKD